MVEMGTLKISFLALAVLLFCLALAGESFAACSPSCSPGSICTWVNGSETCQSCSVGYRCGVWYDSSYNPIDCGSCQTGATCHSYYCMPGYPCYYGNCQCNTHPSCAELGKQCGSVSYDCGVGSVSFDCGSCPNNGICTSAGICISECEGKRQINGGIYPGLCFEGPWGFVLGKDLVVSYSAIDKNLFIRGTVTGPKKNGEIYFSQINVGGLQLSWTDASSTGGDGSNGGRVRIDTNVFGGGSINAFGGDGTYFWWRASGENQNKGINGGNGGKGGTVDINVNYFGGSYGENIPNPSGNGPMPSWVVNFGDATIDVRGGEGGYADYSNPALPGTNAGKGGDDGDGGRIGIYAKNIYYIPSLKADGGRDGGGGQNGGVCTTYSCVGGQGGRGGDGGIIDFNFERVISSSLVGGLTGAPITATGSAAGLTVPSSSLTISNYYTITNNPSSPEVHSCTTNANCIGVFDNLIPLPDGNLVAPPKKTLDGPRGGNGGRITIRNLGTLTAKLYGFKYWGAQGIDVSGGAGGESVNHYGYGSFPSSPSLVTGSTLGGICLSYPTTCNGSVCYASHTGDYSVGNCVSFWQPTAEEINRIDGPNGGRGGNGGTVIFVNVVAESSFIASMGGSGGRGGFGGISSYSRAGNGGINGDGGNGGNIILADSGGIRNNYSNCGGNAGRYGYEDYYNSGGNSYVSAVPGNGGAGGNGGFQGTCSSGCGDFSDYFGDYYKGIGTTGSSGGVLYSSSGTILSYGVEGLDGNTRDCNKFSYVSAPAVCGDKIIQQGSNYEYCEVGGEYLCSLFPYFGGPFCNVSTCQCTNICPTPPKTCADYPTGCGDLDDGCGGTINCGVCPPTNLGCSGPIDSNAIIYPNDDVNVFIQEESINVLVDANTSRKCEWACKSGFQKGTGADENKCLVTTIPCDTQKSCAVDYVNKCGTFPDGCPGDGTITCGCRTGYSCNTGTKLCEKLCGNGLKDFGEECGEPGIMDACPLPSRPDDRICFVCKCVSDAYAQNSITYLEAKYEEGLFIKRACTYFSLQGSLSIKKDDAFMQIVPDYNCPESGSEDWVKVNLNFVPQKAMYTIDYNIPAPCEVCARQVVVLLEDSSKGQMIIPDNNYFMLILVLLVMVFVLTNKRRV